MKKAIAALSVLFLSVAVMAQDAATQASQKKAEDYIKFKEIKYDFGKIKQGAPVTHDFQFTNVSKDQVTIENATASCGCTTPTWPQPPIAKGKSDKITAGFNAANPGIFTKTITVKLSGVDLPTQLTITGEVLTAEEYVKYQATQKDSKKSGSH